MADKDVDAVITLHACDTATDDAIIKALKWKSKIIITVPCCQHELFDKISNDVFEPMIKHGLFKERISSIITDSIRVQILEIMGYDVKVIEFTDMVHTPKNIMLRAVYKGIKEKEKKELIEKYNNFKKFWNIEPYIEKELKKDEL